MQPSPPGIDTLPLASSTLLANREYRLSDEEFTRLRDYIYGLCGIHIADNRKYLLKNRLAPRIRELNLDSYGQYLDLLRSPTGKSGEQAMLYSLITTNETSFYRNPPQLDIFQREILTGVLDELRRSGKKRLRILSAGCSSGEEPYTLAIILSEVLRAELKLWNIRVLGLDLSPAVLNMARAGLYAAHALRTTPPDIAARHFTKKGEVYEIKPEIKKLCSFSQANLSDRLALLRIEPSHFIFCRNVIIYFDEPMKKRVTEAFHKNLAPGGYLFIGHSETLTGLTDGFVQSRHPGAVAYRKI